LTNKLANGEIYSWGVGLRAVHADETQVNLRIPTLNENLKHFTEHEHVHFVKIKAVADQVLALGGTKSKHCHSFFLNKIR